MTRVRRGHDKERQCVRELTARGYEAIRSAGSKKTWDVIAVGPYDVKLIQCKRMKWTKNPTPSALAPKAVMEQMRRAPAPKNTVVQKELWTWVDRKGWTVTIVL